MFSKLFQGGLRLLFEIDNVEQEQLEVLRQEVSKGFWQLAAGEISKNSVLDIFEQASSPTK